jgi:hypothetical protein
MELAAKALEVHDAAATGRRTPPQRPITIILRTENGDVLHAFELKW